MSEQDDPPKPDAGQAGETLRSSWQRLGDALREGWHRHGKPLVAVTRDVVRDATDLPREALEKEREVRVGEAHLQRLLDEQLASARHVSGARLALHDGYVHLRVTVLHWRPVHADITFRLLLGPGDDNYLSVGVVRTAPTQLDSSSWLMRQLLRLYRWYARRRGHNDPFDHYLLGMDGSRQDGETIYILIPRTVMTDRVGRSRVLRRIAAYAEVSLLKVAPGELVVGYHLGKLAERISDLYALRHVIGNVIVAGIGEDAQDEDAADEHPAAGEPSA